MKLVAVVAALMIVGALLPAMSRTPAREITLVAKDMAFYLESDPATPNPTIELKAGERVRIVLRNLDRGMSHDFALPAASVGLDRIDWNQQADLTFDVPDTPGTYEYLCRPHEFMMRGRVIVK